MTTETEGRTDLYLKKFQYNKDVSKKKKKKLSSPGISWDFKWYLTHVDTTSISIEYTLSLPVHRK